MSKANHSAFPMIVEREGLYATGLTKREYFAAMAMQGLLAGEVITRFEIMEMSGKKTIATLAIDYADELLKELEKPNE